nr:MAG TPA: hypothetical protein [Caudoviricetes sp.]
MITGLVSTTSSQIYGVSLNNFWSGLVSTALEQISRKWLNRF